MTVSQSGVSADEARRQLELVAEQLRCPDDPWCQRCACADSDDVCFPDEAVRELRAAYWAVTEGPLARGEG